MWEHSDSVRDSAQWKASSIQFIVYKKEWCMKKSKEENEVQRAAL